jgi:hypothetical protein
LFAPVQVLAAFIDAAPEAIAQVAASIKGHPVGGV